MSSDEEGGSGSITSRVASIKLTRRGFIGATAAVPFAAHAEFIFENSVLEPEHVDLSFSTTDGLLKVAIEEGQSRERQAFWSRLGVNTVRRAAPEEDDANESAEVEQRTGPVWSIETARFGPETKVRFRNQRTPEGRRRYTVTLHDVSYGRVSGRTVRFIFDEHLEVDTEGRELFEDMKRNPDAVGRVIKERLEKLTVDAVPMRRVYTIRAATDVWSLRNAPTSKRWFELEPAEEYDAEAQIDGALRLDAWVAQAPKRRNGTQTPFGFSLLVDAGRITSTLQLVFNGQVGYADKDAGRNVLLSFDQSGTWRVAQNGVFLNALAPELELSDFMMRWQPVGGEPLEEAPELPPESANGNPPEDDDDEPKPVPDIDERSGPSVATGAFELVAQSRVAPGDAPLVFKARGLAPGLTLQMDPDARGDSQVLFRILEPTEISPGKVAPGQLRSEASLLTDWAQIDITGNAKAAAGPFETLRGRLLERVDAPARMNDFDYAQCEGSVSFGGDFKAAANRHWRIDSPIGPLGFRGPAPEDDAEDGTVEDPFRQRHGDQVQAVFFWGRQKKGPFVPRRRPRTDWIEVNGVLREAAVELEEADFNRLTFAPTSLTLLYTPNDLPAPQTSYIRLAAPKGAEEIGQLDLSDAALVASRTDNLLGLTFRFGDMALSMQRDRAELVRRNASCPITTDRELDGSHDIRDGRPVLVVEFPGQHLFEEAFFRPGLQELPDVIFEGSTVEAKHPQMIVTPEGASEPVTYVGDRVFLTALPAGAGWRLDPNDRQQVVDLLRLLDSDDAKVAFRTALNTAKVAFEEAEAQATDGRAKAAKAAGAPDPEPVPRPFAELSTSFVAGLSKLNDVPADQRVYIGPYALDPDVMRVAMKVWRQTFEAKLTKSAERLLARVAQAARDLHRDAGNLGAASLTEEMRRIARADASFEGALALEQRLETQFPSYQLFRSVYRDLVLDVALEGLSNAQQPAARDKTPFDTFAGIADVAPEFIEATHADVFDGTPAWMGQLGLTDAMIQAVRERAKAEFVEALKGKEPLDMPARGRIANPSRLAFRVRCRDGISVARNRVATLDIPSDARAEEVRDRLPFSLSSLTRFSDFDLSVVRRAQAVYRPSETGRIDVASRRRLDLSQGARLDLLNFTSGPFVTSGTRLGEIARSLTDAPHLRETAIEIPARLTLSPDQNAVVVVNSGEVPDGIYCKPEKHDEDDKNNGCHGIPLFEKKPYVPLWSAEFLTGDVDPNLRAIHSPDLRPDVFTARAQRKLFPAFDATAKNPPYPAEAARKRFPGASAPPRGPIAPWHIGEHQTQTRAMGVQDVKDPLPTQPALSRLFAYLAGEKERRDGIDARDMKFRAAIDAYARHELVLLSSGWGLPVLGRRKPNGQLVADSGQSEPELRYRLADVEEGSALYEPRTLQTIELSLTPIGGTLRHASSFEPFAAAFDSHGDALFDAVSVESWQQWTNLGRDVHCEIVYKGFLWPIGQRASLVQVTEREFFIDPATGAIRAALRQRLFIRVGKAEKLFPALKQPAQGRRFPVERLKNLTTQTPDIVDPSDDELRQTQEALALPGGRVQLGQAAKGLVFWPRTAKLPDANVRFELDLDGTVSDMPLLFVDNVAANDPGTLSDLAAYYNALPTPDPLTVTQGQREFDPVLHVRTLDMGGGKRRYAAEKEAGSASAETQLWTLCATGLSSTRSQPEDTARKLTWKRQETVFRSDPVLQGADQPPFYPAVECCRIRVRQAERLIGRPLSGARGGQVIDARFLRAMPDAHYVEYGLPATTGGDGPVEYAIEGNVAETYLAMIDQLQLTMGDKGDNAGGVYRPSGRVVGLSRSRGVLTWSDRLNANGALACDRLLSVAGAFEIGEAPKAVASNGAGSEVENLPSLCSEAPPVVIDPNIQQTIEKAKKLYSDIVDGNAKILGLVSIKQLFEFIQKLDPPSTGMPELAEQAKYGAKEVQSAIGQVDNAVGDALSALDETVDLVRTTVIVPLAEAIHDIREGWDELDRDIERFAKKVPARLLGNISFAKIFPDLHCTLVAFDAALARAIGAADAIAFTLAVSEVFAAGRRFLDALFRAASDPGRRIEAGLRGGIEGILELINVLEERRAELVLELASQYLEEDAKLIKTFADIALYFSGQSDTLPFEVKGFADKIVTALIPEDGGPAFLPIFAVPPVPNASLSQTWNRLQPTADEVRDLLRLMIILQITTRGGLSLEDLLEQTRSEFTSRLEGRAQRILEGILNWRTDSITLAEQIKTIALERLEEVEGEVAALADSDAKKAAQAALAEYRTLLESFENVSQADVKAALKRWIKTGFSDEWNLFRDTERHVREAVAGIQAGDFELAFNAIVRLAELHFGPMTGFETLCKQTLEPFQEVATAIYPGRNGIHAQIAEKLGGFNSAVTGLKAQVDGARSEIASARSQLDAVAPEVEALGAEAQQLLQQARRVINVQLQHVTAAQGELAAVAGAIEATVADVAADRARMVRFAEKFELLANFECNLDSFGKLGDLDSIHRDFRQMIVERRALMQRVVERAAAIATSVEKLVNNPAVQLAAGGGVATLAASELARVMSLGDFTEELETSAQALVTNLNNRQAALQERANAYVDQAVALLLTHTEELRKLLESAKTMLRRAAGQAKPALVTQLEALLGTSIKEVTEDILEVLDEYTDWLAKVRVELEKVQSAAPNARAEALAKAEFAPPDKPNINLLRFLQSPPDPGIAKFDVVNEIERRLVEALEGLADQGAVLFTEVSSQVVDFANDAIAKVLNAKLGIQFPSLDFDFPPPANGEEVQPKFAGKNGPESLLEVYQQFCDFRNGIAGLEAVQAFGVSDVLFVEPDGRPEVPGRYMPARGGNLEGTNDRLAGDVAWLEQLATEGGIKLTTNKSDDVYTFLQAFLNEWRVLRPTPVEIGSNIEDIVTEFLKGDLFAAIDFTDLRDQVEDYILSLVPTQIDMSYGYGVELGDKVRQATAGIFAPGSGSKLTIEAGIKIDLGFDKAAVHAKTVGRLDAFDVKLVGDAFDALTLKFNGATFTAETGKKMQFEISYSDYEIGPMLEFVQQFQSFLTPKGNSGFYLEPQFSPLGVEAGYILNLGDFSVGAMAISNVGLATAAILPFEDKDARFKASLSTRLSPFTITYTPYGGSGFFGIEANANGILGFEASFEFGGSAVFAFGPLTGQGRLMAGFYIRQSIADNGQKLTELSATFFVGGTAQIWVFSFAASLSVRLGMVNGDMSGEAIFSFSFSMGLADFEYSVVLFKKEAKGFSGQQQASLRNMPFGQSGMRFAELGLSAEGLEQLDDNVPRIDTRTACQARNWRRYADYFTDDVAEDLFE